ncbi:MAG: hypothetical protein CME06_12030 [Gemmatimonadetes bacterium]|nr:hypothetical protein [Gemmatimonadota bacterium]
MRTLLALILTFATTSVAADPPPDVDLDELRRSLMESFETDPAYGDRPAFLAHLKRMIEHERHVLDVDERVAPLLGGNGILAARSTFDDLSDYFQACSEDSLTMLRSMGAIASLARDTNTLIYMDGRTVQRAMADLSLTPGLALPIENMRLFAYIPNPERAAADSSFQCDILAIFDTQYKHRFQKEVLDANLKIGTGELASVVDIFSEDPAEWEGYLVRGMISKSEERVGFMEVSGIGGEKRGLMGFMQKVLFFLPDAIDAMTLDSKGTMTTKALIDERIEGFEGMRKYQVHRIGEMAWEKE